MTSPTAQPPAAEAARPPAARFQRHLYPALIALLLAVHLTTMLSAAIGEARQKLDRNAIGMLTLNEEGRLRMYSQRLAKLVALQAGGLSDVEVFRRDAGGALANMQANFAVVLNRAAQTAADRPAALDAQFTAVTRAVHDLEATLAPLVDAGRPTPEDALRVDAVAERTLTVIERYMAAKAAHARDVTTDRAIQLDMLATMTLVFQVACLSTGLGLAVWAAGLFGGRVEADVFDKAATGRAGAG